MKGLLISTIVLTLLSGCGNRTTVLSVLPTAETVPVGSEGDAADDPAIVIHPRDPQKSVIIGTNKNRVNGGLQVYRFDGSVVDTVSDPGLNNVDLRGGFPYSDGDGVIVVASRRRDSSIAVYRYDWESEKLTNVEASPLKTVESYGICIGRNPESNSFYAYVNEKSGRIEQWELIPGSDGKVEGKMVRVLTVSTQPEGCVVDDEQGVLFVGEEIRGVWKFNAWPEDDTAKVLIDSVYRGGVLTADVEGMSLYTEANGEGYLVVSSQGDNSYVLYDRKEPHQFVSKLRVVESENIDGTSETDGLDVSSANLGKGFRSGALVVQDGHNEPRKSMQNFKIISWDEIGKQL